MSAKTSRSEVSHPVRLVGQPGWQQIDRELRGGYAARPRQARDRANPARVVLDFTDVAACRTVCEHEAVGLIVTQRMIAYIDREQSAVDRNAGQIPQGLRELAGGRRDIQVAAKRMRQHNAVESAPADSRTGWSSH
jgi:hypothetical protein